MSSLYPCRRQIKLIHQNFECEFYFIRHGQSESNAMPDRTSLNADSSLTRRGFAQARLLGERLKQDGITFDKVYCSSLVRTVQTTQTMLDAMGEANKDFAPRGGYCRAEDNGLERLAYG